MYQKLSIIGVGMITTPGVSYRMFQALSKKNKHISYIYIEIKISVLISKNNIKNAIVSSSRGIYLENNKYEH